MNNKWPLVSIIMPVKNVASYIEEALRSILDSTYRNIEIICVNDQCSDNTIELILSIDDPKIRVVDNNGKGYTDGVNTGIKNALGYYIMNSDGDDIVELSRIGRQVQWLQDNPDYGAICGNLQMLTPDGKKLESLLENLTSYDITSDILTGKVSISHCSYLFKRSVFESIEYRRWFVTAPDLDFQYRLAEFVSIWFSPEICFYYRIHNSSATHIQPNNQRVFFENMAKLFAQQRNNGKKDDLQKGTPPKIPDSDESIYYANSQVSRVLMGQAWRYKRDGHYFKAVKTGLLSLRYNMTNLGSYKSVLALIIKRNN